MKRILLAVPVLLSACGVSDVELLEGSGDYEPNTHIYNGSAPDAPEHEAVVALHQLARGGRSVYVLPFCSGTLIEGDIVLTAAHCLAGMTADKVAVFVGDEASTDPAADNYIFDHLYSVSEVKYHESYDSRRLVNDIGILRLSTDAAAAEGVAPVAALPAAEGFTTADIGTDLNFAGFGVIEDGSHGTKLQVDVPLGALGCGVFGCPTAGDTATQISYSQGTDGGPCSGDSGGPAFIYRGGTPYVGGLTSYGDSGCTIYGVSTRTDAYESWIGDFFGGGDTGGVDTGGGDTGVGGGTCDNDGVCETGESCDGRSGTSACGDCDGVTNGKPTNRYCYVEGVCEGDGCP